MDADIEALAELPSDPRALDDLVAYLGMEGALRSEPASDGVLIFETTKFASLLERLWSEPLAVFKGRPITTKEAKAALSIGRSHRFRFVVRDLWVYIERCP